MDPLVRKTIEDILGDHQRQGGKLKVEHVERLLVKRQASPNQMVYVYRELSRLGVDLEPMDVIREKDPVARESDERVDRSLHSDSRLYVQPALTAEEVAECARSIQAAKKVRREIEMGQCEDSTETCRIIEHASMAREKLILANTKLVRFAAKSFKANGSAIDMDDLIQEGLMGLMIAVDRYDHSRNVKLSVYAMFWIRQRILRYFDNRGTTIRFPVHVRSRIRQFRQARQNQATIRPSGQCDLNEIATSLGWDLEKTLIVAELESIVCVSGDRAVSSDTDDSVFDQMPSSALEPELSLEKQELGEILDGLVEQLTSREAEVLHRRFGLDGEEDRETLESIGADFGISRERIRQIERDALKTLRHPVRSGILEDYRVRS